MQITLHIAAPASFVRPSRSGLPPAGPTVQVLPAEDATSRQDADVQRQQVVRPVRATQQAADASLDVGMPDAGGAAMGAARRPVDEDGTPGDDAAPPWRQPQRQLRSFSLNQPMPAAVLSAMFDQMGGAATSVWKGMHVNLVV
jgi:hypothetical protein